MSDTKETPATKVEVPPANKPKFEDALEHLDRISQELVDEYAGKAGVNPYTWIEKNVTPLKKELLKNPTDELIKKALAIKKEVPSIEGGEIPVRLIPQDKLQPKVGPAAPKK